MLSMSWTTIDNPTVPAAVCTVVAARLPLRSYRNLPALTAWTIRVRRQLRRAPGLLGYQLAFELHTRTLWTVSAWTRRLHLAQFDGTGAHGAAKRQLRPTLHPSTLAVWNCSTDQLPVAWAEIRRRINDAR